MHYRFPSYAVTVTLMVIVAVCMMIQGTWGVDIAHHWAFIVLMLVLLAAVGWQAYRHDKGIMGLLSHGGLALLLVGVLAGDPWTENGNVVVDRIEPARIAYTDEGAPMALPFEISLDDFTIDHYEGGYTKQFRSTLLVKGLTARDTASRVLVTEVNHPARYHGYHLYQEGYDMKGQQYTLIKVVKEPLLPLVYIAMALLALGSLWQIKESWKNKKGWLIGVSIGLAILFTGLSLMRIHMTHLMPALRSWWFVPHLGCYMIAYSMLAIAIVLLLIRKWSTLSNQLLHTASALLLLGMLCGAVWAKQAWGDYWTWDPKECWAAATWLLSLVATHSQSEQRVQKVTRVVMMIVCFAAMQITWYGVNYLPSAMDSLHTYTMK